MKRNGGFLKWHRRQDRRMDQSGIRFLKPVRLQVILLCMVIALACGCGNRKNADTQQDAQSGAAVTFQNAARDENPADASEQNTDAGPDESAAEAGRDPLDGGDASGKEAGPPGDENPGAAENSPGSQPEIAEDGSYTSAEDVALYLHVYGRLPGNFMTKKEARALGWEGGSLERFAPGMCIGGDRYGNYEGNLPDGNYRECDIDTLGRSKRGARRLVYDDEGNIYYTEDHYETFTQLYEGGQ